VRMYYFIWKIKCLISISWKQITTDISLATHLFQLRCYEYRKDKPRGVFIFILERNSKTIHAERGEKRFCLLLRGRASVSKD
jgi:hypothetical protein